VTYPVPWTTVTEKRVKLTQINRDPNAQARWMQVATNVDIERIAVLPGDCPGDYLVVNDFHSS